MREFIQGLIHFQNEGHELYFYFSMIGLFACIVLRLTLKTKNILNQLAFSHLVIAIVAVFMTTKSQLASETFSSDCIWFNGLMSVVYIVIYYCLEPPRKIKIQTKEG